MRITGSPQQLAHPRGAFACSSGGPDHVDLRAAVAQFDADVCARRRLGRGQPKRHEHRWCDRGRNACQRRLAIRLRGHDPATREIRIDTVSHCDRRNRHASWLACGHDQCLELGAVFAPAAPANPDFLAESVHVSTNKLSGHEHPMATDCDQGAAASRLPIWRPLRVCLDPLARLQSRDRITAPSAVSANCVGQASLQPHLAASH